MKFRFGWKSASPKSNPTAKLRRRPGLELIENRLAPAAIVGGVFNDVNGDGIHQSAEPGMVGVPVFLDLNGNGKFDPSPAAGTVGEPVVPTGIDGRYLLLTNAVGTFDVLQIVPPNFTQTTNNSTKVTLPPTVPPGNIPIPGPTFGNHLNPPPPPTGGVIHGVVFVDASGDGIQQSTEGGQPGVVVFIDANGDGKLTPSTTSTPGEPFTLSGPNGGYEFHVAKDGSYSVLEVVPPGFNMTSGTPAAVSVSGGALVVGPAFGNQLIPPPPPTGGTIHGTVFVDMNGDGIRQNTEPGQGGVVVFLDLNGDGKLTPGPNPGTPGEPATMSGPNGEYGFKVANNGTYSVLEVVPPNYTMTTPAPAPVTVAGGTNVAGPNFGNKVNVPPPPPIQFGFITGRVFLDANSNGKLDTGEHGMHGVRVYDDANSNGKFDAGERFAFSNFYGRYALGLTAGTHTVLEVVPGGFTQTAGPGTVTIVAGQGLFNQNIGNAPILPPAPPFAPSGGLGTGILVGLNGIDGIANEPSTAITFQGSVLV